MDAPQAAPSHGSARNWLGASGDSGLPAIGLPNVLWFFGAITGVAAAISIVDRIPESHRDLWEFLASFGFLVAFALAAWILTRHSGHVPGGLAAAMAAAMVPAAGYGFTQLVHAFPRDYAFHSLTGFDGTVFGIALATVVAALVAYALTRLAFNLALAVLATLLAAQLLASSWHPGLDGRATTEVVVGAALVLIGLGLDARKRRGEAFWLHLGGLYSLTTGLDLYALPSRTSNAWISMLIVGTALLVGSPYIARRTWVVFGAWSLVAAVILSQTQPTRGTHSIVIGAVVTSAALLLDATRKRRLAWWMCLGGLLALLEGLIYLSVNDLVLNGLTLNGLTFGSPVPDRWIPMLVLGAALLAGFVVVGRKIWVVFGAIFVAGAATFAQFPVSDVRVDRVLVIASVVFAIGLFADLRKQRVTGFWLQLWGLLGVAAALIDVAATSPNREAQGWAPILVIAALLLLGAAFARRRLWVVFGTAGVVAVFGHYLDTHSGWFRYVLLAIGLVVFALGLVADRKRAPAAAPESPA